MGASVHFKNWLPPDASHDIQIRNAKPGLKPIRPGELAKRQNSQSAVTSTNGTASNSDAARFEKTDKPYKLADANGLYLEVDPSGGKYWRFKYRFEGKEKRLSLGVYPVVSLADAREARDECRKQLAKAIDPGIHRKAAKASRAGRVADSFETVEASIAARNRNSKEILLHPTAS